MAKYRITSLPKTISLSKAQYGGLHKFVDGGSTDCPKNHVWDKYTKKCVKVYTLANDQKLIDGVANWAMHSDVPISMEHNEQIKHYLYSGKYGYDPVSGSLYPLKKEQKTVADAETKKILAKQDDNAAYRQSIIDAGFDPDTFGKSKGTNVITGEEIYGDKSQEDVDKINKEAVNNFVTEGHRQAILESPFNIAANFTPMGMAAGVMQGGVALFPDAYNFAKDPSWSGAGAIAMDALMMAPAGKGIGKAISSGFNYSKNLGKSSFLKDPTFIPQQTFKKEFANIYNPKTKSYNVYEINVPQEAIPGRSYADVQHKMKNLRKDLNINPLEHFINKKFGTAGSIGLEKDAGMVIDSETGRLFDSNTRYWLNREYGILPKAPINKYELAKNNGKLVEEGLTYDESQELLYKLKNFKVSSVDDVAINLESTLPGSPNAVNNAQGLTGFSIGSGANFTKQVPHPDFYLDIMKINKYSPSQKKYFESLIQSVKNQGNIATERQFEELQRIRTGNYSYGKKGYSLNASEILKLPEEEILNKTGRSKEDWELYLNHEAANKDGKYTSLLEEQFNSAYTPTEQNLQSIEQGKNQLLDFYSSSDYNNRLQSALGIDFMAALKYQKDLINAVNKTKPRFIQSRNLGTIESDAIAYTKGADSEGTKLGIDFSKRGLERSDAPYLASHEYGHTSLYDDKTLKLLESLPKLELDSQTLKLWESEAVKPGGQSYRDMINYYSNPDEVRQRGINAILYSKNKGISIDELVDIPYTTIVNSSIAGEIPSDVLQLRQLYNQKDLKDYLKKLYTIVGVTLTTGAASQIQEKKYGGALNKFVSGGEAPSTVWRQYTGTSWSEAKKQGLTDGSAKANLALRDRLLAGEFGEAKMSNEEVAARSDAYKNMVGRMISRGATLEELVTRRIGTKEGLTNMFSELSTPVKEDLSKYAAQIKPKGIPLPIVFPKQIEKKIETIVKEDLKKYAATIAPKGIPLPKVFPKQIEKSKPLTTLNDAFDLKFKKVAPLKSFSNFGKDKPIVVSKIKKETPVAPTNDVASWIKNEQRPGPNIFKQSIAPVVPKVKTKSNFEKDLLNRLTTIAKQKALLKPQPINKVEPIPNSMAAQFSKQDFNKKSYDNTGKEIKPILWDPDHTSGSDPNYKVRLEKEKARLAAEKAFIPVFDNSISTQLVDQELYGRQKQDNERYGKFMKRGKDIANRTDVQRNIDSEQFFADIAKPNSVIIDIGSALGNSNSKLAGVSVWELTQNPKIKQKKIKVIATDLPDQVESFKEHIKNKKAYNIDYAEVPMTFNTPIYDVLKTKNLGSTKDVYLRAANSIDLLMTVAQTKEHFYNIAKSLKDKNVTYVYNNMIFYKSANSTSWSKIGNINNAAFDHNSASWKTNKNRKPYALINDETGVKNPFDN